MDRLSATLKTNLKSSLQQPSNASLNPKKRKNLEDELKPVVKIEPGTEADNGPAFSPRKQRVTPEPVESIVPNLSSSPSSPLKVDTFLSGLCHGFANYVSSLETCKSNPVFAQQLNDLADTSKLPILKMWFADVISPDITTKTKEEVLRKLLHDYGWVYEEFKEEELNKIWRYLTAFHKILAKS